MDACGTQRASARTRAPSSRFSRGNRRTNGRRRSRPRLRAHWHIGPAPGSLRRRAMLRSIAALIAMLYLAPAGAQEAGSRILTTPQVPQPKDGASLDASDAPTTKIGICERLEGDARKRCLQEPHAPKVERAPNIGIDSGPGSTGMGSG